MEATSALSANASATSAHSMKASAMSAQSAKCIFREVRCHFNTYRKISSQSNATLASLEIDYPYITSACSATWILFEVEWHVSRLHEISFFYGKRLPCQASLQQPKPTNPGSLPPISHLLCGCRDLKFERTWVTLLYQILRGASWTRWSGRH